MPLQDMSFKEHAEFRGLPMRQQHTFNLVLACGTLIIASVSIIDIYQGNLIKAIMTFAIVLLSAFILWSVGKQAYFYYNLKKEYKKRPAQKVIPHDWEIDEMLS